MPARRLVVIVAGLGLVTAILAGCAEAAPVTLPPAAPPIDCRGVPAETCRQAVDDARVNAKPGEFVVQIRVVCVAPSCTQASGEAQVDVLYTNGRHDNYGTRWDSAVDPAQPAPAEPPQPDGSEPAPAPLPVEPVCVGVPPGRCQDQADNGIDPAKEFGHDPGEVVGIVVRCTVAMCTDEGGSGDTIVTYRDGTTSMGGWSYAGASSGG